MLPKQHSRECLRLSSGFALYSRGEPDGDHVPVLCQKDVQWALGNNKTKKDWAAAGQRSLNMALQSRVSRSCSFTSDFSVSSILDHLLPSLSSNTIDPESGEDTNMITSAEDEQVLTLKGVFSFFVLFSHSMFRLLYISCRQYLCIAQIGGKLQEFLDAFALCL